jgi:glycosyltransferase involved in cell wall biosynthesis
MTKSLRDLTVAIDAQISPDVAGGTETALLSLISALGRLPTSEQFVLLGLDQHGEKLRPFMGSNQTLTTWPWTYRWYAPNGDGRPPMGRSWRALRRAAGPLGDVVSAAHRFYAEGEPLGARAERIYRIAGPLGRFVVPAYRFYRGVRRPSSRTPSTAETGAQLRAQNVQVVHFPYPLHFATRMPFVYEPWGLPHLHFPELFQPGEPQWMDAVFRSGCEDAALVVTATRWVKRDIVSRYGIPSSKVAVIPRLPREVQGPAPPEPRPGLPSTFAFFPAMTWPTKNHIVLLKALARLRDAHGLRLDVVCTGRVYAAHWPKIETALTELRLNDQVRFLGPVSDAEMHSLFRTASFLVFPSLFEGLGLPVLEAFQHGLPVIASNGTCLPEVVGDAGIIFDAHSDASLTDALLTVLRRPGVLDELRAKGRARYESMSREKMAKMFVAAYRTAARAPLSDEQRALVEEMTAP